LPLRSAASAIAPRSGEIRQPLKQIADDGEEGQNPDEIGREIE
jgi:hypothetical protein